MARSWGQQKPPLGSVLMPGHPLAQGLIDGVLLNELGGTPVSLRGRTLVTTSGATTPLWGPTGSRSTSSTGSVHWAIPLSVLGSAYTVYFLGSFDPIITANMFALMLGNTGSSSSGFGVSVDLGSASNLRGFSRNAAGTTGHAVHVGGMSGARRMYVFTCNASGSMLYVDGVQVATGSGVDFSSSAFNVLGLHTYVRSGTTGNGAASTIETAGAFNRLITQSEVAWLYAEPYAFVAPPQPRRSYVVLGAGPTVHTGAVVMAGTGGLLVTGTMTAFGQVAMDSTGTQTVTGVRAQPGQVSLTSVSDMDVTGTRAVVGQVGMSGTGTLAATGTAVYKAVVTMIGVGTMAVRSAGSRLWHRVVEYFYGEAPIRLFPPDKVGG